MKDTEFEQAVQYLMKEEGLKRWEAIAEVEASLQYDAWIEYMQPVSS